MFGWLGKTNLGHSETAAGITGFIKAVLCLRQRMVPASLHYSNANPNVDLPALGLKVATKLQPFPRPEQELVASVSSFGFGGTNAHAVLSSGAVAASQPHSKSITPPSFHLLWLSARSEDALDRLRTQTADWLEAQVAVSLHDLCASIHMRRSQFPHALACIASDKEALIRQLRGQDPLMWSGVVASRASGDLPGELEDFHFYSCFDAGVGIEQLQGLVQSLARGTRFDWKRWHEGCFWHSPQPPGHPFMRSRFWWSARDQARTEPRPVFGSITLV